MSEFSIRMSPLIRLPHRPIAIENMKTLKREYELRIREIKRASDSTGGMGSIATTTYKRLASLLADKRGTSYSQTMGWLRCRLSFSLLQCIRGARSNQGHAIHLPASIELTVSVSLIPLV